MTNCPNCGYSITDEDKICPNCGFNLQKYREEYFTDRHEPATRENEETTSKMLRREVYRSDFKKTKPNSIVAAMVEWIRANSTIVFIIGVFLLILMSFSRTLGWITFFALMVWLFIVCERNQKIKQYTVDKRLTDKMTQLGSDMVNGVETRRSRLENSLPKDKNNKPKAKILRKPRKHTIIEWSVTLTSLISLVVFYTSSGYGNSISAMILQQARMQLGTPNAWLSAALYAIWFVMTILPMLVIYETLRIGKIHKVMALIFSLIETIFLLFVLYRINLPIQSGVVTKTGQFTSQFVSIATAVGASFTMLIFANLMTSGLAIYNVIRRNKTTK